jgi:biopolymer transport protein ExbB/TolQ
VNNLQQTIYDISRVLLWPVLIAALICLVWVLGEFGVLLYELWLRFRYRDLDALQARTLRARKAFADGKPRSAYRYLQENNYSIVVARFLFDLIRNYQTERLEAKPLKLLQEYEFYTIKRLERTRILVRLGPMLGLMGTLIPLSPALIGLASGNTEQLAVNLTTAFSVTVVGLLIGGVAFVISIVRDRLYSQDISDMEYLLELLEGRGGRLKSGRRLSKRGVWESEPPVDYEALDEELGKTLVLATLEDVPVEPLIPVADGAEEDSGDQPPAQVPAVATSPSTPDGVPPSAAPARAPAFAVPAAPAVPRRAKARAKPTAAPLLGFEDPDMDWQPDEDPFADLGPVDPRPPANGPSAPGTGEPDKPR